MDKATVKLLLESYRPRDAADPIFAEALREVARDPELAAWFEETQRFDSTMTAKFHEVPVPADVKNHILLGYNAAPNVIPFPRPRVTAILGSIAALLALTLFSWHLLVPSASAAVTPLAEKAISFTGHMPPLQFVCFDPAAVADWVNHQPGAHEVGIQMPKLPQSLSMKVIGSSVVNWNGRPVVMICLQNDNRMAMLYILKASDAAGMKDGTNEVMQKADWVVRATRSNDQIRLLATKGGPDDLNFPMPF